MQLRLVAVSVVVGASLVLTTTPSLCAPAEAREAYEVGKRAYDAGDYTRAARSFARADALAPNARVLELALAAANKADAPVLGMELADRARARNLPALAVTARDLFASKVGEVRVSCPRDVKCDAKLDDEPIAVGTSQWATIGEHSVALDVDGVLEQHRVQVEGGRKLEVEPTPIVRPGPPAIAPPEIAPPTPRSWLETPPPEEPRRRLSSTWFWVGASATGLLATGTVVSGLHTVSLHDDLMANRSAANIADQGHTSEVRTNVLLVSTAVVAVATGIVSYFVFRTPREGSHVHASGR